MTKVLIVDDNEQNLYMLQALLRGNGYQVTPVTNGAEALSLAWNDPPDLVITDILMPVMDGFSLCHKWKSDERLRDIPLVFYTATYTDARDQELALNLGAEAFIVKPQEPRIFLELIREALENFKSGQLVAPREPVEEEQIFLREYNEALVRKLEDKMLQLEQSNKKLEDIRVELEQRVTERTAELRRLVNAMAGREVRMAELKEVIHRLRGQLIEAGLEPVADDPLQEDSAPD